MMNASLAFYMMHILQDVHDILRTCLRKAFRRSNGRAVWKWLRRAHHRRRAQRGRHCTVCQHGRLFCEKNEITILFTAVADKHYHEMIGEICEGIHPSHVVATQIDGSRVVPAEVLAEDFRKAGCTDVCAEPEIGAAYEKALGKRAAACCSAWVLCIWRAN